MIRIILIRYSPRLSFVFSFWDRFHTILIERELDMCDANWNFLFQKVMIELSGMEIPTFHQISCTTCSLKLKKLSQTIILDISIISTYIDDHDRNIFLKIIVDIRNRIFTTFQHHTHDRYYKDRCIDSLLSRFIVIDVL